MSMAAEVTKGYAVIRVTVKFAKLTAPLATLNNMNCLGVFPLRPYPNENRVSAENYLPDLPQFHRLLPERPNRPAPLAKVRR